MKKNQVIINSREVGKTTYLYKIIEQSIICNTNVILLDSATDHEEKSLLKRVIANYPNSVLIENHDERKVATQTQLDSGELIFDFPYNKIMTNIGKIICFDLSYFLEKGHEAFDLTGDQSGYEYYRGLYRRMSQQILSTLIALDEKGIIENTIVVTDEIEFPIVKFDPTILQRDLRFFSSVHPENSFGTFYKNCEILDFVPYQKRKEI